MDSLNQTSRRFRQCETAAAGPRGAFAHCSSKSNKMLPSAERLPRPLALPRWPLALEFAYDTFGVLGVFAIRGSHPLWLCAPARALAPTKYPNSPLSIE